MQCTVTYVIGMYSWLSGIRSEIQIFNFGCILHINVSKDVRIRGYFFEDKRCSQAKTFGNCCFR